MNRVHPSMKNLVVLELDLKFSHNDTSHVFDVYKIHVNKDLIV